MRPPVSIIVPTMRRPDSLRNALQSLFNQNDPNGIVREIVVVDNDPLGSAWPVVFSCKEVSPSPLIYVHEPCPGVANARNAGLAATDAPIIAFLDDDETAAPDWLVRLYAAHLALSADVTFGPIKGVTIAATPAIQAWLDAFYSRTGPDHSVRIGHAFGCGASMMTRKSALNRPAPFDPDANATGGEDDRLFEQLKKEGVTFGWAADAWVYEHPPESRCTPRYALRRAIAYGQSPCQQLFHTRPIDWITIFGWMIVGALQTVVFALGFLALRLVRHPGAWPLADRAARGLGKVLWMVRLEYYGSASRG